MGMFDYMSFGNFDFLMAIKGGGGG